MAISQLGWRILHQLNYLEKYFKSKGRLPADRSIEQTNKRFCKFLCCSEPGLIKARKGLIVEGKIKFCAGSVDRNPSRYWVLASPQGKQKAGVLPQRLPPISLSVLDVELRSNDKESVKKGYVEMGYSEADFEGAFERVKR